MRGGRNDRQKCGSRVGKQGKWSFVSSFVGVAFADEEAAGN